ncbi:MAG: hypothetical protein K5752_05455 [Succinivibrionaceae bacterium]|nr:hypothetical protein [Succinivibrionaceae bacterium]
MTDMTISHYRHVHENLPAEQTVRRRHSDRHFLISVPDFMYRYFIATGCMLLI